jgi:hypothetical protein
VTGTIDTMHGTRLLLCADDGPVLAGDQDATDLVGEAISGDARFVVLPVSRLDDRFFQLRTGLAGVIVQKFAVYRRRLAIIGDIAARVANSPTLRDFVAEVNRGDQLWFLPDLAALEHRLAQSTQS